MESHFEYGTKAAWWRIADSLERLGVPATVSTCGRAAELSPWLIEDAVKRGHEISCHGWRWEKHAHMKEDEEREAIAKTVRVLTNSLVANDVAAVHGGYSRYRKELLDGGLRVGYNWNEGKYEAALFGRNITDEEVAVGAIDFNNRTGFLNEPRIVGVQFKANF